MVSINVDCVQQDSFMTILLMCGMFSLPTTKLASILAVDWLGTIDLIFLLLFHHKLLWALCECLEKLSTALVMILDVLQECLYARRG